MDKLQFAETVASKFTTALIRKCPTLNTAWFSESLYQTLKKKDNVEFKLDTLLSGYYVSHDSGKKGHVEAIVLDYEHKVPVDDVVLCVGP